MAPKDKPSTRRYVYLGTRSYLGGIAAIAALTGLLVGLSKTPVVDTFMPLLLGLLAAGGGAAAVLGSASNHRRRMIGWFFSIFSVACLAGILVGGLQRSLSSGCT